MPTIDESLAWGRIVIPYTTAFADHITSLHCREVLTDGSWQTPYGSEATVAQTIHALLEVMETTIPASATFNTFKVFKNMPDGAPAELFYLGAIDMTGVVPTAADQAALTVTLSWRTSLNRQAKMVWADTGGNSTPPLRVLPTAFDAEQLSWFNYVIDNPNIVTIDGENITAAHAITVTQNDVLTRRYGMAVNTVS